MNWHDDVRNGSEILTARHALPGHRAFTEYASSDARIDLSKLKKVCGNKFPSDPVEQNRTWYRLYKTVEGNPAVSHVHRDFLLMRDYAGLAALFMIFFGTAALIEVPSWRASLTYCFVLSVQFLVVRHAASTFGVLGRRSEKQSQTPPGLRPQAPIA